MAEVEVVMKMSMNEALLLRGLLEYVSGKLTEADYRVLHLTMGDKIHDRPIANVVASDAFKLVHFFLFPDPH